MLQAWRFRLPRREILFGMVKDASIVCQYTNTGSAQLAEGKDRKGKMLKRYRIRDYDFKLILLLVAVTVIGILSIGSAEPEVQNKQILGFVMGMFIMIVLSFLTIPFSCVFTGSSMQSISYFFLWWLLLEKRSTMQNDGWR